MKRLRNQGSVGKAGDMVAKPGKGPTFTLKPGDHVHLLGSSIVHEWPPAMEGDSYWVPLSPENIAQAKARFDAFMATGPATFTWDGPLAIDLGAGEAWLMLKKKRRKDKKARAKR